MDNDTKLILDLIHKHRMTVIDELHTIRMEGLPLKIDRPFLWFGLSIMSIWLCILTAKVFG